MRGHAAKRPTVDELLSSREQLVRASAQFFKIDLATALTFLKIARETKDELRKARNCRAARRAYDAVARLSSKVVLSASEAEEVDAGLKKVKTELEKLGAF